VEELEPMTDEEEEEEDGVAEVEAERLEADATIVCSCGGNCSNKS
jgi:hypothetical protein